MGRVVDAVAALLGKSAYMQPPAVGALTLDSPTVESIRRANGGQIAMPPVTQTRWYLADLEAAEFYADRGDMALAARLMRAARKDGVLSGVLSTRTSGLVRLPKKFRGDPDIVAELEIGHDNMTEDGSVRSRFDEMFPSSELATLAADGELLGVGVGEMLPVVGRDYKVFARLDPEYLRYRWNEGRWYYSTLAGEIPVEPGDGRWILHTPGGRIAPWQHGLWRAVGRAYIRKEHASLHKDNWEGKLANPARVAFAPQSASEDQKEGWFQAVAAWGINTVFSLIPGYDVKLLESNGRGWDSFNKTIQDQNQEFQIAIAGQTVTTDGGTGFANADIHKTIRADLIQATAEALAYTINTQGIPNYVMDIHGEDAVIRSPIMSWDVTPAKDLASVASSFVSVANAVQSLTEAFKEHDREIDIDAVCAKFGIPIKGDYNGDGKPEEKTKPKLRSVA